MTVSSPVSKVIGEGNGATTVWPFSFKVYDAAHLTVIYTDADGVEHVLSTGFSVSLNASQETNPGGTVTYSPAIASGTKLTILRVVPYTQTTDIKNQGGYYPEVLERRLDLTVMQVQQLAEQAARSVKVDASSSTSPDDLLDELQADVVAAAGSAAVAQASAGAAADSADAAAASEAAAAGYAASINPSQFAPKASPALTGTPTAPTAAPGTNTTQLATTAFVKAALSTVSAVGAWIESWLGTTWNITTAVPNDDTRPLSSEGTQIASVTITVGAGQHVEIEGQLWATGSPSNAVTPVGLLCRTDQGDSLLAVTINGNHPDNVPFPASFSYSEAPGAGTYTYTLRAGPLGSGAINVNATTAGTRIFGDRGRSGLRARVFTPV